ncbi:hypothetical protein LOC71_10585 [Rhodopirellula sp. JC740]|uniref:Polysaccharide biosynthesis protein n=1 Tax=Rhodopirellula halodulae TaxID=2894198 RepID=A0ABS8NGN1_9BACT|nr:hypothetical protein [Rhodopirellula sp. JC740]MCC9642723.1 hypothetical protein [Rhodopirellula sp. JC740]
MSASVRVKKMLLAVFLGRGVMAVRQLLMVPLLIRFWGTEYYGEWLVVSAIPSFLAMSNLGLGTAASIQIGMDVSAGRNNQAWTTFVSITLVLLAIVIGVWLLLLLSLFTFPGLLNEFTHLENAKAVILVLVSATLTSLLSPTFTGWWVGVGKASRSSHWANLKSFVELLVCLAIPWFGGKAVSLAIAMLVWNCAWLFAYASATLVETRKLSFGSEFQFVEWQQVRVLLFKGLGHQLSPLWQAILFQGSILLAAKLLGPSGAAMWGALRVAARSGCQVLELVSQSLRPEFQIAAGVGDEGKLRRLHSIGVVVSIGIAICLASVLLIVGRPLFLIWTRNAFVVDWMSWWLLMIALVPFSAWWVSGEMQRATNSPWFLNAAGVLIAVFSLVVMGSAAELGIAGFCIGMLFFECLMACCIYTRSCRLLHDAPGDCFRRGVYEAGALLSRFIVGWQRTGR